MGKWLAIIDRSKVIIDYAISIGLINEIQAEHKSYIITVVHETYHLIKCASYVRKICLNERMH